MTVDQVRGGPAAARTANPDLSAPRPRRQQAIQRQKRAPSELALRLSSPCTSPLLLCTPRSFTSAFPLHRPLCEAPDAASDLSGLPLNTTRCRRYVNRFRSPSRYEFAARCAHHQRPIQDAQGGRMQARGRGPRKHIRAGGRYSAARSYATIPPPDLAAGGVNSVGRVLASQAGCRGFESRTPLHSLLTLPSLRSRYPRGYTGRRQGRPSALPRQKEGLVWSPKRPTARSMKMWNAC